MSNNSKKPDSMIKFGAITVLGLLGLSLLTSSFFANNSSANIGRGMMHGMKGYGSEVGLINGGFGSLGVIIIQLLGAFMLIALLVGFLYAFKKFLEKKNYPAGEVKKVDLIEHNCPQCGIKISDEFKFCPACTTKLQKKCYQCSNLVQVNWRCCPYCGERKEERK